MTFTCTYTSGAAFGIHVYVHVHVHIHVHAYDRRCLLVDIHVKRSKHPHVAGMHHYSLIALTLLKMRQSLRGETTQKSKCFTTPQQDLSLRNIANLTRMTTLKSLLDW